LRRELCFNYLIDLNPLPVKRLVLGELVENRILTPGGLSSQSRSPGLSAA